MARFWLGPVPWNQTPFPSWGPPAGVLGWLDFAAPESAPAPGAARPVGFFATGNNVNLGSSYARLGTQNVASPNDILATNAIRDAFLAHTGYRPTFGTNGITPLSRLVAECLMEGADPDGLATCKPLVPVTSGDLEVWLAGVRFDMGRFRWGTHAHTNRLRDLVQRNVRRIYNEVQAGRVPPIVLRRVLGSLCRRYGLSRHALAEWQEFVPLDLRPDVEAPLEPTTTITESFNTANSGTLGPDLTWAEVFGDFVIDGNRAAIVSANDGQNGARAEHDLSSDDHSAQCNVYGQDDDAAGPACRYDAAANTHYWTFNYQGVIYLSKLVAGTQTNIVNTSLAWSSGDLYKVEANGSTIKAYSGVTERLSTTDTAITGHLRCGFCIFSAGGEVDNFEAADLAPAGGIVRQMMAHHAGVN